MKEGTYLGAIRSVECLRQRCRVDDETGCWHWGRSMWDGKPKMHVIFEGKRSTIWGRRAALMLWTGKRLPDGHVAYPTRDCKSDDCVNPEHARSTSRANFGQAMKFSGKLKTPAKAATAVATARATRAKLTWEAVREIRASDETPLELAARFGVSRQRIYRVLSHEAWKEGIAQSSVFSFRPDMLKAA